MEDILEIVKKLKKSGILEHVNFGDNDSSIGYPVCYEVTKELARLHIETQTYLLAEILEELRKANNPPVFHWDFGKQKVFPGPDHDEHAE
jgi:DNA-binding Lrp family transcriptional regulator